MASYVGVRDFNLGPHFPLSHLPTHLNFLYDTSDQDLGLTNSVRLAGQQVPGILVTISLTNLIISVTTCQLSTWLLGLNSGHHAYAVSTPQSELSSQHRDRYAIV